MQTPIDAVTDAVFDGMGFDELGRWHKGSFLDFWRWSFADLQDANEKEVAAELITKMLLGVGPGIMTAQEMQFLRMSSLAVHDLPRMEPGWGFDA